MTGEHTVFRTVAFNGEIARALDEGGLGRSARYPGRTAFARLR